MLQIIVAIVVAVWFYRSARAAGKSAAGWAFGGLLAFLVPSIPWAIFARFVLVPGIIRSDVGAGGAIFAGLAIGLIGIGLGLALAFWVHKKNLRVSA